MYRVFFHNILGGHLTTPTCHARGPQEQTLTSKRKKGIHCTRQVSGQEGLEKQEGEEAAQSPLLSQPQTAGVDGPRFSHPPSYSGDREEEPG